MENRFRERRQKPANEIAECTAETGVALAADKIEELVRKQDHVVVAIIGSNVNVGKTYISAKLEGLLMEKKIPVYSMTDISLLNHAPRYWPKNDQFGKVLILRSEFPPYDGKEEQDARLSTQAQKFSADLSKIDLRIYVYRPDKPFHSADLQNFSSDEDLLINNSEAVNK